MSITTAPVTRDGFYTLLNGQVAYFHDAAKVGGPFMGIVFDSMDDVPAVYDSRWARGEVDEHGNELVVEEDESLPEREGWGAWSDVGDGESFHAYQTSGRYGVMGKPGDWSVCYASDGVAVVELSELTSLGVYVEKSYDDAEDAMRVADRLEEARAEHEVKEKAPSFTLWCEGVETDLDATTLKEAREEARDRLTDGVEAGQRTFWVHGRIEGLDEDGDKVDESIRAEVEPEEPECTDAGGHTWTDDYRIVGGIRSNPGCWGHGGGVITREACIHCGCAKVVDTWAQDRTTGEQGLTAVEFEKDYYTESIATVGDVYALIDADSRIVEARRFVSEDYARAWASREGKRLVSLDLPDGATVDEGDLVTVDEDGHAELATEDEE